ncbi:MAG: HAD-IA family hydrolase [Rhodanobacter sp.]
MLRAVIWDVDGTLAETECDGHRVAFNRAFAELDLPWHWDVSTYGRLLRVAGGRERLLAWIDTAPSAPQDQMARERLASTVHQHKARHYHDLVGQGLIAARPGVIRVSEELARAGIALAVATTTGHGNVDALFPHLFGARWRDRFAAAVCAEDAARKKPDPQVYQVALARLNLGEDDALAIEDSPAGLHAALASGVCCLVTRGSYFAHEDFSGASHVCADLDHASEASEHGLARIDLPALRRIHAGGRAKLDSDSDPG